MSLAEVEVFRLPECVLDLEEPAGAVDEADDDGDVAGLSENDRARHVVVVRSKISGGEHGARWLTGRGAVDIISTELVLVNKQRASVLSHIGGRRVEEARLRWTSGLFSGQNNLSGTAPSSSPPPLGTVNFERGAFATLAAASDTWKSGRPRLAERMEAATPVGGPTADGGGRHEPRTL